MRCNEMSEVEVNAELEIDGSIWSEVTRRPFHPVVKERVSAMDGFDRGHPPR